MTVQEKIHTHASSPLDVALELADTHGWYVFPVKLAPKGDGKHTKIYLAKWGSEATNNPELIERLNWREATHVGVSCAPSGVWVVDEDEAGAAEGLNLPETLILATPRGRHYVYKQASFDQRNTQSNPAPKVDIRANGGMFVFYGNVIHDADIAPWPFPHPISNKSEKASDDVFRLDTGGEYKGIAEYERLIVRASTEGEKHAATRDIAASLAAQGVSEKFAAGLIKAVCPVWDANLERSISSAYEKYARPKPKARGSTFYSAASLEGKPVPERQWLVQGLVPQKTVTLFSGDGGTGKSLLALQLAVAVTAQTAWIGKTVNGGRVIFLSAEDDNDELHRRLEDILTAEGRSYDDLTGLTLRSLAGEDALLAVDSQLALMQSALFEELDERAAEEGPVLIVIDTLADVYPANENDRAKVRQFVGILRGLAIERECAVLLLGHPSLTGLNSGTGTSGSTAWNNSVRSRLYLSRITDNGYEADPDARVLSTKKANYGRTGGEINLKWEAGVFVAEAQPTGLDALAAGAKGERVFLKLLEAYAAQGRRVNASGGKTYAPKEFAEHPESEGVTKRAFKAAMDRLLGEGKVRICQEGPPSRRVSFLEVAR